MLDARRFIFLLPSGEVYGNSKISTGIYSSMQFCIGGQARSAFPINIECDSLEKAEACLDIIQPIADAYRSTTIDDLIRALARSRAWQEVCSIMDGQSNTFWVVLLGKKVGIHIQRAGAVDSLLGSPSVYRRCDRFSTFNGAFIAFMTAGRIQNDFIGRGTGPEEVNIADAHDNKPSIKRSTTPGPSQPYTAPIPQTPKRKGNTQRRPLESFTTPQVLLPEVRVNVSPYVSVINGARSQDRDSYPSVVQGTRSLDRDSYSSPLRKKPMTREPEGPMDYGYWFNLYLEKFSFEDDAYGMFHILYQQSEAEETFVEAVVHMEKSITKGEASFIYHLMSHRPEGPQI